MEINELLNLKTDKEKIIEYLKFKENLTFEQTGIRSFIPADFDEMENWSEEDCCEIWEKLRKSSQKHPTYTAFESLCPWCLSKDCMECGYGERHGFCNNNNSLWQVILTKMPDGLEHIKKCQKFIIEINKEEEFKIKLKELPINILKELICIKEKKL